MRKCGSARHPTTWLGCIDFSVRTGSFTGRILGLRSVAIPMPSGNPVLYLTQLPLISQAVYLLVLSSRYVVVVLKLATVVVAVITSDQAAATEITYNLRIFYASLLNQTMALVFKNDSSVKYTTTNQSISISNSKTRRILAQNCLLLNISTNRYS